MRAQAGDFRTIFTFNADKSTKNRRQQQTDYHFAVSYHLALLIFATDCIGVRLVSNGLQ